MLDELLGQLVEVVHQLDLAAQRTECLAHGTPTLQGYEPGHGPPGALDDDLLAALRKAYQPRQLALRFVHADSDDGHTLPPVSYFPRK